MRKVPFIVLALLGLCAAPARALEIKNVRSVYGPAGSVRPNSKLIQGDILFLSFDIEGAKIEATSGLVRYKNVLEVLDGSGKSIFKRATDNQRVLYLGGTSFPERAQVATGIDQAPGKYTAKLTVIDVASKDPKGDFASKSFTYEFELLPTTLGLIQVNAPSVGVVNQEYIADMLLVGMARDDKMLPSVEIRTRIFDEKGKPTMAKPLVLSLPAELPKDFDIKKATILRIPVPLFLNRAGRFTVEIVAEDAIGKKSAKVTFPLEVIDTGAVGK
jgi:hypothetical protein